MLVRLSETGTLERASAGSVVADPAGSTPNRNLLSLLFRVLRVGLG